VTAGNRPGRARRSLWTGLLVAVGAIVAELLRETAANVLAAHVHVGALTSILWHDWLYVVLVAVSLAGGGAAAWSFRRVQTQNQTLDPERIEASPQGTLSAPARRGAARGMLARTFPSPASLVGQHAADAVTAAAHARRTGVVLVTGAVGSGASAVSIAAAWELAPDPARQRYVDLRASADGPEGQRRAVIRVLRVLGLRPDAAADPGRALAEMAVTLRGTGTVLVLDNAGDPEQVSWISGGIPGAYVIACGDVWFGADPPHGVERVRVRPLDPDAALELLARQGEADAGGDAALLARGDYPPKLPRWGRASSEKEGGGARARARRWLAGLGLPRIVAEPPANTVAARIAADRAAARQLARHLGLPRVAIDMGRWLAANPRVSLADLVDGLHSAEPNTELRFILSRQLDGTSPGARRLLALLARAPAVELTEAAVAKLAGLGPERTGEHLAELTSRSLVTWPRPSKCRITTQARQLAKDPALAPLKRGTAGKSRVRLAAYYARLAAAHTDALDEAPAQEWLGDEDAAMLRLLCDPEPPRAAAAHLWQVADMLDAWFAREQRPQDRRAAAEALADAAEALRDPAAGVTACLRLAALARDGGDFGEAARQLDRAGLIAGRRAALRIQVDAAWTAHLMVRGDLDAAGEHLLRCRAARPRRDAAGRVTDLANQGALELRRGETDAAHGTLSQAQALAVAAGDIAGQAHVHELSGIAAALAGQPQRAAREWERALDLYAQRGDAPGQARCLQHHGTLLQTAPAGDWDAAVAPEMLSRSVELRGEHPAGLGPALAHLYLAAADQRAGGDGRAHREAGLEALEAWPHQGTEPPEVTAVRTRLARTASPPSAPGRTASP
jgi:tetratricopeptide (TPR) repeat protein